MLCLLPALHLPYSHVCACLSLSEVTDEHQCDHSYAIGDSSDSVWVISAEAANYGIECESREGEMTAVKGTYSFDSPTLATVCISHHILVQHAHAPRTGNRADSVDFRPSMVRVRWAP